ncbi:unnamed protein product [Acanthoscelides obtectus]|uniref:RNB domain-containing protein n=1 Tax=Acanthoscelides obtectus TaxID=200917 RepID=A0A9P0LF10_ACAOB|nr:unnamed protein product [Acanthoscelides obtectus]CAK1635657.1 DIS3-like exonuclease 2 [Acanthoscelides obtectus]
MEPISFPSTSKAILGSQWTVRTEVAGPSALTPNSNKKVGEKNKKTRRSSRGKTQHPQSVDGIAESSRNLLTSMANLSLHDYSQLSTSMKSISYGAPIDFSKKGNPNKIPAKSNANMIKKNTSVNVIPKKTDTNVAPKKQNTNVVPKKSKVKFIPMNELQFLGFGNVKTNVPQKRFPNSTIVNVNLPHMNNIHNTPKKANSKNIAKKVSTPKQADIQKKSNTATPNASAKQKQISKVTFNCSINPVKAQKSGRFLRKRNTRYRYVNLKSFGRETIPHVFNTSPEILKRLIGTIKKRIVDKTKPKSELRKYPKKNREKADSISQEELIPEFPEYMSKEDVEAGIANSTLIKGFLRINPKNCRDSYVSNEDTTLADYYLTSVFDRNRALEGDEVVLQIKPESNWVDGQKTARVVFIKEMVHSRVVVGSLKPESKKNADYALLYPRDKRCPVLRIPEFNLPNFFKQKPEQFENIIFVGKILKWDIVAYAQGVITENLGQSGDLKVETLSILREFQVDITPFSKEMTESLPLLKDIPEKELEYREDLRKECIFTIDPETARDLDDAVSVKQLENGNLEVGVHIADASFFLEEGTELDQMVSKKATTIYLVDKVFHMLPVELCMNCSLLPGEDKLSFSVFWEMTEDAEIVSKRFSRSIMNSCTKLAYEHAQIVIENPDVEFTTDDFPTIHNGFTPKDLVDGIKMLQKLAAKLRENRIENGALRIDQVKLIFNLDPNSGEPTEFSIYENKEAHRLIEEYMLLANISVAEKIKDSFPDMAFLRCHESPKHTMLLALQNSLSCCGIDMDVSSSKALCSSVKKYSTNDHTVIGVYQQISTRLQQFDSGIEISTSK